MAQPHPKPARELTAPQKIWRNIVRQIYKSDRRYVFEADVVYSELPRDIGAELINTCNADCSFCGYGKGPKGKAADPRVKSKLDMAAFRHVLKLYSEAGGGHFSLTPILGEVSAHPDWLDMVREARSYPNIRSLSCFTNGILLHRFGFTEILQSGLTAMTFSTSLGSKEQYDRLYGVDKYDQVVSNLLGLIRENKRLNYPVEISVALRIDKPYDAFFNSPLYAEMLQYLAPSEIGILDGGWDDFRGIIKQDGLPKNHTFKAHVPDKSRPCYAMFRKMQVMLDGTMQACSCRVEPELWGGNIKDYDTLQNAWRDPGLEKLRNDWFAGRIPNCCQGCSHYQPYTALTATSTPHAVAKILVKRALVKVRKGGRANSSSSPQEDLTN